MQYDAIRMTNGVPIDDETIRLSTVVDCETFGTRKKLMPLNVIVI